VTVAALLSLALSAAAPPPPADVAASSLVLIVASNRGTQGDRPPLQYADDDGAKYFEVFSTIAGEENTLLLTEFDRDTSRLFPALLDKVRSPTRAQLDSAAARLSRKAAEARRAGRAVRFHFVFAGHGDVDEGRGFLELADGPFTADDLQALVREIGASEAHVILDSCNSFFVVNPRKPGGVRFATPRDAAETLARRLPNVGVFISTSAKAEVYEWSELQSGVFSHAVRSGLMGAADANGDGRVTYEELAGFVETAVADIKNPLFRPTVFARGPNGEDARPILDLPPAARTVLTVDDASAVRLAARDAEGLRWIDAHKEAGETLRLWFPASATRRLEIDRLKVGPADGGQVESSFALPARGDEPVKLSALAPSGSAIAMRGPGEIFRALFSRPFGPIALAAYLERRATNEIPLARDPRLAPPAPPGPESAPGTTGPSPGRQGPRSTFAVVRPGVTLSWSSTGEASSEAGHPSLSVAAGRELNAFFAAELEAGYAESARTQWRFYTYPSEGYRSDPIPGTSLRVQLVPIAMNARLQLPTLTPRPYLLAGAGVAATQSTIDPPDFNATLRATRWVPFFHAGLGLSFDVGDRLFGGVEGRYFLMRDLQLFGSRVGLAGASAAVLLGARL
jgi:hypothetical protein